MEFDENKKLDVAVSQNEFVENRVSNRKKRFLKANFDVLDLAIIPLAIGVFVSLGFLFANLFRATSAIDAVSNLASNMMI